MTKNGRVSGVIMGAIAGDCLGTPYVFMRSEQLFEQASHICWEISENGICSQILSAGIGSVARYGMNFDALVRAYCRWANSGSELDCVTALCFNGKNKNAESLRAFSSTLDHGALCSDLLLIRQIPIVLAGIGLERDTLFKMVESECRLTHDDEESIEYAQLYAYCLQGILQEKSRLEIWDDMFGAVRSKKVYGVLLNSYYEKPRCDDVDYCYARTAFGVAMYHFWHDSPIVSCLRSVILAGGATDVNGAAAGALCGAWQGICSIPVAWRDTLLDASFGANSLIQKTLRMSSSVVKKADEYRPVKYKRMTERRVLPVLKKLDRCLNGEEVGQYRMREGINILRNTSCRDFQI